MKAPGTKAGYLDHHTNHSGSGGASLTLSESENPLVGLTDHLYKPALHT